MKDLTVGFIGQGYVGKNYADNFSARGIKTIRYSLEEPYVHNKDKIAACDVVFIAVPTPTTPEGFDARLIEESLVLVGKGKVVVIKSTVTPGTTQRLQESHPDIVIFFSPEFLCEATAAKDVANPFMNLIGVGVDSDLHHEWAQTVLGLLPRAPYENVCTSTEAEIVKYMHNGNGYLQVLFFNLLYDLAKSFDADWKVIQSAAVADPYISNFYTNPIHKSGRGAGGHCFIKDFAALREVYEKQVPHDRSGSLLLQSAERKNRELLTESGKDLDLLHGVYGSEAT